MEKVRIQEGSGEECEMKNGPCRQGTFRSGGRKAFPQAEQLSEVLGVGGQLEEYEAGYEIGKMCSSPIPQGFRCCPGDFTHYSQSQGKLYSVLE